MGATAQIHKLLNRGWGHFCLEPLDNCNHTLNLHQLLLSKELAEQYHREYNALWAFLRLTH